MKPGTRLKSAVDDTEVMVIKNSGGATISCGGAPMSDAKAAEAGALDPAHSGGTQVGKRYVDEANTIELLCVKAGKGSLSADGAALAIKDAKPLPSSD